MFIDYSNSERRNFLSQSESYLLPGYTGHCPTLKFRIGKRYGANTREIIQEISKCGILNRNLQSLENSYQSRNNNRFVQSFPKIELNRKCKDYDKENQFRHCGKYILGYTGYIPGMYFHYGKSFRRIVEDCEKEFSNRQHHISIKDLNNGISKVNSTRSQKNKKIKECGIQNGQCKISETYPPISGYTGHIPMLNGQLYHNGTKIAVSSLNQDGKNNVK